MNHFDPQPDPRPTFADLVERRYRRRDVLAGAARAVAAGACASLALTRRGAATPSSARGFRPVPPSSDDTFAVPAGYDAQVLLRWGDPLLPGAPAFDPRAHDAAAQRLQFGHSCDFNGFFPLAGGADGEGLLVTNHEFVAPSETFFGAPRDSDEARARFEVELAAHGCSVAHVRPGSRGALELVPRSRLARRVTGGTAMRFDGPAAGSAHLRTSRDPSGRAPSGTIANCGGGVTPWGTYLTCEENFDDYFGEIEAVEDATLRARLTRAGITPGKDFYGWSAHDSRFDLTQEPNEPNRFGWVVEFDPYDPASVPVKHTALGRFEHEAASTVLSDDGRAVVYLGDDARFEYLYKFVSAERFVPGDRARNRALLSRGTLFVARFEEDGAGRWMPLVPEGPLSNWSVADICVHARAAADLLGATPMDRPEDVEVEPLSGRVFVCLTNNSKRESGDGGPNPRAKNRHGQIAELMEEGGDHAATRFVWSLFMVCGDPADESDPHVAYAGRRDATLPAVACPDNIAFDRGGTMWLATDGQPYALGTNDALWAVSTIGPERGVPRRFATGPVGCELSGPCLADADRTLFLSVQHPGSGGGLVDPTSRWPHDATEIPRPAVVAVRRADGGELAG